MSASAARRRRAERPVLDEVARRRRQRLFLDMLRQDCTVPDPYPHLDAALSGVCVVVDVW